ncbi:MAG: molybdopterin molybdotransferase MoeA [Flavobacteriales bacterium]|nr:molybdopterin molybdotransferase MoeA [Flavobacteriales bacterium]
MISVEEARGIIMAEVGIAVREGMFFPPEEAIGRNLMEDLFSGEFYPRSDVSAVDGYAVGSVDGPWTIVGELMAGQVATEALRAGEAVRINTGAQVPKDTVAVLMQEHCTRDGERIEHAKGAFNNGANIRRKGESVKPGDRLLAKGSVLSPAAIGLLASCGVYEVMVAQDPTVSIIRTGGEFLEEGETHEGSIHSSNEKMLLAALNATGIDATDDVHLVFDEEEELSEALLAAAGKTDVVITTGGASVGDHDLLLPVLKKLKATVHFHGVAQKPGKPMFFATLNGRHIFGLPGNPRAALVLFYEYVLPFLLAMRHRADPYMRSERLPIGTALTVKGDRAEFRAARVSSGRVELLADEGSHMLRTLVEADALAYLPTSQRACKAGDLVEVHYLPQSGTPILR